MKNFLNQKNIFITSFNSLFFKASITLVSSLHKTSIDTIDKIIIYNLGLKKIEKDFLNTLKKVEVIEYPATINNFWDGYLDPTTFAWKCFAIRDAKRFGDNILYLDSGAVVLKDLKIIYEIINKDEIFLVGDKHINRNWTHKKCFEIMNANEFEINDFQLWAGILGYKTNGKYQQLINDAFEYSKIKECIAGDRKNHRHDQSIYSILASRYKCPRQDILIFGEWQSLKKALSQNSVIYVHRRLYYNDKDLIDKNNKKITLPVKLRLFLIVEKIINKLKKTLKPWYRRFFSRLSLYIK